MTRCEALLGLIGKYETLATRLLKVGDVDLAHFYKSVATGFKTRLNELALTDCMEELV